MSARIWKWRRIGKWAAQVMAEERFPIGLDPLGSKRARKAVGRRIARRDKRFMKQEGHMPTVEQAADIAMDAMEEEA